MQISSDEPAEPLGLQISCSELLAVVASYVGGAVKKKKKKTLVVPRI